MYQQSRRVVSQLFATQDCCCCCRGKYCSLLEKPSFAQRHPQLIQASHRMPRGTHVRKRLLDRRHILPDDLILLAPSRRHCELVVAFARLGFQRPIDHVVVVAEILQVRQLVEFLPRALFPDPLRFPGSHLPVRGEGKAPGPDTCDDGSLPLGGTEGENFVRQADESEGRMRDGEDVSVEVLHALARYGYWGTEGRQEGEGIVVSGAEHNGFDVAFDLVVGEADSARAGGGWGQELCDPRHIEFPGSDALVFGGLGAFRVEEGKAADCADLGGDVGA